MEFNNNKNMLIRPGLVGAPEPQLCGLSLGLLGSVEPPPPSLSLLVASILTHWERDRRGEPEPFISTLGEGSSGGKRGLQVS